jgi:hypothetical protein
MHYILVTLIQSYFMQIVYYITHVLLLHFIYMLNTINQSIISSTC